MAGPLGQHQAVSASFVRVDDILDDLLEPVLIGDEVTVDRSHSPW